jgi:signal transduction histidine kinase
VLASLAMQSDMASEILEDDPLQARALLSETVNQATSAVEEIRRIAHGLRPPALDDLGLAAALRQMAQTYRQNAVINVEIPQTLPPLPAALETAVYRITQEALANVARHSGASRCLVRLAVDDGFNLTIHDNGRGMGKDVHKGVGLHSMQERVDELGGQLKIIARPAEGTRIEVCLPLAREET